MIRFIVIALATLGSAFLLGRIFPSIAGVAFVVGGFGITWLFLACSGVGILAYRATK